MKILKRFTFVLVVIVAALLLIAAAPMADAPEVPAGAAQALQVLIGFFAIPLINWIKDGTGWDGKRAVWLAFVISLLMALISLVVAGFFTSVVWDPQGIINALGVVMATATLAYKLTAKE